jgi:hypothetical protein
MLCYAPWREKSLRRIYRSKYMRIYAVNCDSGRADRLRSAAAPLDLEFVLVPSPLANDPEVVRRGATCFARNTSYPTGFAATIGHLRAMERFLHDGGEWGIIIEDDVRFHKDFKDLVLRLQAHITDADIVSLGFVNFPVGTPELVDQIPLLRNVGLSNPWGAQCYMITREYARHLVDTFSVDDVSIPYGSHFVTDWVLFDPVLGCRRHTLMNPIALEGPEEQTIAGSTNKPDLLSTLDRSTYFL